MLHKKKTHGIQSNTEILTQETQGQKKNTEIELRKKFECLQTDEPDFSIEKPGDNPTNTNKSTRAEEKKQRQNVKDNNNQHGKPNICTTESYLLNENQTYKRKVIRPGLRTMLILQHLVKRYL